ncbi:hypothetical protein [Candidatus Electrothrix sp.]|uniref:hypothetical protein n=1 Tax=Candidatus Electrothrix sp. TaxID=2170559 RepID=UPI004055A290
MKKEKDNTAPKKAEQEHLEDILLELFVFSASLGFIGRLLIDAKRNTFANQLSISSG